MGIVVTGLRLSLEPYLREILLLPLLIAVGAAAYGLTLWLLIPDFIRQFTARFGRADFEGKISE